MTEPVKTVAVTQQASSRAATFLNSLGVNTHLSWWDTSWGVGNGQWAGAESKVVAELTYLDVQNIRDSTPQGGVAAEMIDLGKDGYKFDLLQNINSGQVAVASDMTALAAMQAAAPGSIIAYEGANEYNSNSYMLNGQNSNGNMAWGAIDDQVSQAALKASPSLSGISYVAASTGSVAAAPVVTPYVSESNWHVYGGVGQQLKSNLASAVSAANATAPGKQVFITETGVSSAAASQSSWGTAGDEFTQGLIDTNAVLDDFNDGASKTYLYDLMDNNQAADLEDNFGLFNADGTPKAAAVDLHNLTTILADTGTTANSFATTPMTVSLTGLPATASDMVLEKSNGTHDLVLWNSGAIVWNTATNTEATPATSPVTVQLGGVYQTVKVYDPLVSSSPIQTLTQASSVSLSLSKDPLIVEVSGSPMPVVPVVPVAPAPTKLGSGPDTLIMQMSEDAWQGDAQFTISVDGKQVGGTQTVTASHALGQRQEFDVAGSWGTGSHQVSVDFLNDAWGGTATTDRNLYDNSATYDGTAVLTTPITQLWSGSEGFGFTSGSELDLAINEDAWKGDAQFTVSVDGTQVGGVETATTLRSSGTSETFALYGNWGTGAHTVSVDFLNDAYGGTAVTDRNLYVTGASFNGAAVKGAATTFMSQGTQSFSIPATVTTAAAPAASTASLVATPASAAAATSVVSPSVVKTYDFTDSSTHSLVTAAAATDVIKLGSGYSNLTTQGSDTLIGGSGSSTISALSGSLSLTGGSGSMTFMQGGAASSLSLGSGAALIDIVNGMAGGSLAISDFVQGRDYLHLSGYAGTGIKTEQLVQGSTQITLTDNTQIDLRNFVVSNGHSIFS